MKKVLLSCLTALMCCATSAWAVTGSGTQSDPYVIAAGESYTIPAGETVYAQYAATAKGILTLTTTAWENLYLESSTDGTTFVEATMNYDSYDGYGYDVRCHADEPVIVRNSMAGTQDITVTAAFVENDYLEVVSATPAVGSELAELTPETPITVTFNKPVGYMYANLSGGNAPWDIYSQVVCTQVDETTWTLSVKDAEPLYESTYTILFNCFETEEDYYGTWETRENAQIYYVGTTAYPELSDAYIVSITPDPDNFNDLESMLSSENNTLTVTFNNAVKVEEFAIALGQGMGLIPMEYTMNADNTVLTAEIPIESTDTDLQIYIKIIGADGNQVYDDAGTYRFSFSFSDGSYTLQFPVADGRHADTSLTYEGLTPKDGAYVSSLSEVKFVLGNATEAPYVTNDPVWTYIPYVYDAEGNIVAQVLPTIDGDTVTAVLCEPESIIEDMDWETWETFYTYTATEITTPGVYTVNFPERLFGDQNFDPWTPWQPSYSGVIGRCNADWTFTYNVVDEVVTVQEASPAPYNVSGEYVDAIPATVELTMSSSNFVVNSAFARYGMNTRDAVTYEVKDGNVLVLSLSEAAQAEGRVSLIISAAATNGAPVVYGATEEDGDIILLTYQTDRAVFTPTTVTPSTDSNVEELSNVVLTFGENVGKVDNNAAITVTDSEGNVTEATIDYDAEDFASVVVTLANAISAEGTYTLTIPEGTICNDTYDFGFVDDEYMPVSDLYNPELTYVYVVGVGTGITSIKTDANGNVKVYTVEGVYVGEGEGKSMINGLPSGLYIINGTKVAIK